MNSRRLVTLSLRLFVVSIVATALVGMYVVALPGENWEYQIKVLLTTATIAGASICGLACGTCLSRGRQILPTAGLVLTGLAAGLTLIGIWVQPWRGPGHWKFWEAYWKTTASLICYAIACAHLSMLFLANLVGRYRWAYLVAYYLILGLATVIVAGIVFEYFDKEEYWRLIGSLSILVATITLMVPVFHRFSREELAAEEAKTDSLLVVEEELARVKKRLIELENKRRSLLGRIEADGSDVRSKS